MQRNAGPPASEDASTVEIRDSRAFVRGQVSRHDFCSSDPKCADLRLSGDEVSGCLPSSSRRPPEGPGWNRRNERFLRRAAKKWHCCQQSSRHAWYYADGHVRGARCEARSTMRLPSNARIWSLCNGTTHGSGDASKQCADNKMAKQIMERGQERVCLLCRRPVLRLATR